jgi:hypothetical protein
MEDVKITIRKISNHSLQVAQILYLSVVCVTKLQVSLTVYNRMIVSRVSDCARGFGFIIGFIGRI